VRGAEILAQEFVRQTEAWLVLEEGQTVSKTDMCRKRPMTSSYEKEVIIVIDLGRFVDHDGIAVLIDLADSQRAVGMG
jgi:hypothetical protein